MAVNTYASGVDLSADTIYSPSNVSFTARESGILELNPATFRTMSSGDYLVEFKVEVATSSTLVTAAVTVNGAAVAVLSDAQSSPGETELSGTAVVAIVAGDDIRLQLQNGDNSAIDIEAGSSLNVLGLN